MRRFIYYFVIAILVSLNSIYAQEMQRCATTEYMEMLQQQDPGLDQILENNELILQNYINSNPELLSGQTVVVIPVVVHVIWNTSAQNIPDAMITSQIQVLNEDYRRMNADTTNTPNEFKPVAADTKFEFRLADRDPNGNPHSGVNRVFTNVTSWNYQTQDAQLKALSYWPSQNYLNIWTANLSGGILGYAQFPGGNALTDGVVILWSAFGRPSPLPPYHLGRTTTHEVGHWLNLRHIWGDDNGACTGSDLCDDTPNQANYYFGCPAYPQNSCGSSDMFMNYMDYTDDVCMNIFTNDQTTRKKAAYTNFRPNLWVSFKETIDITSTGVDYNFTTTSGQTYATLNFSSLGTATKATIEVFPNLYPLNIPSGSKAVKRYWNITANGTGYTATLTVYYNDSEVIGFVNGDSNLKLWRYNGTNWVLQGGTVNTTANTVTLAGVTEFSQWALSDPTDNPIPVELMFFSSMVDENSVTLSWITATEVNNQGFEVERVLVNENNTNEWKSIGFVQGKGTTTQSSYYSFIDSKLMPGNYQYRLKQMDIDGSFEYSNVINVVVEPPLTYSLSQNYPNPFNPVTTIQFQIPSKQLVSLKVYDALGVEVASLVDEEKEAGIQEVSFDASGLTSGVYYYMLKAGSYMQANKMILLK
jgi:hypothetical protein